MIQSKIFGSLNGIHRLDFQWADVLKLDLYDWCVENTNLTHRYVETEWNVFGVLDLRREDSLFAADQFCLGSELFRLLPLLITGIIVSVIILPIYSESRIFFVTARQFTNARTFGTVACILPDLKKIVNEGFI